MSNLPPKPDFQVNYSTPRSPDPRRPSSMAHPASRRSPPPRDRDRDRDRERDRDRYYARSPPRTSRGPPPPPPPRGMDTYYSGRGREREEDKFRDPYRGRAAYDRRDRDREASGPPPERFRRDDSWEPGERRERERERDGDWRRREEEDRRGYTRREPPPRLAHDPRPWPRRGGTPAGPRYGRESDRDRYDRDGDGRRYPRQSRSPPRRSDRSPSSRARSPGPSRRRSASPPPRRRSRSPSPPRGPAARRDSRSPAKSDRRDSGDADRDRDRDRYNREPPSPRKRSREPRSRSSSRSPSERERKRVARSHSPMHPVTEKPTDPPVEPVSSGSEPKDSHLTSPVRSSSPGPMQLVEEKKESEAEQPPLPVETAMSVDSPKVQDQTPKAVSVPQPAPPTKPALEVHVPTRPRSPPTAPRNYVKTPTGPYAQSPHPSSATTSARPATPATAAPLPMPPEKRKELLSKLLGTKEHPLPSGSGVPPIAWGLHKKKDDPQNKWHISPNVTFNASTSITANTDGELARLRSVHVGLAKSYGNIMTARSRAQHELAMSMIELDLAEKRRIIADSQLDRAREGALGIDYVQPSAQPP